MKLLVKELEEAQRLLLTNLEKMVSIRTPIEASLDQVVYNDVHASTNVPAFSKSAFDGFALKASDTIGATQEGPVKIKILTEIKAGDTRQDYKIEQNNGVKVLTGAPIPRGIDAVVKKEDVDYIDSTISIKQKLDSSSNIIEKGADIKNGDLIIKAGDSISPYHLGAFTALGMTEVLVYNTPRIGVISTGGELKELGEELQYGQIYNSNLYTIVALINSLGASGKGYGCVDDNIEQIKDVINRAIKENDLVITTGGVSVGDYDLVEEALVSLGASVIYNRLNIKPGTSSMAAKKEGKLIVALSGNPGAALISFELLIKNLIKKMRGFENYHFKRIQIPILDGFKKSSPHRRFLRAKVFYERDTLVAVLTGNQQSSVLKSMIGCNALIDIPAGSDPIEKGTLVNAILLKNEID